MVDKQPALFRKVLGALRPVTPAAEELLASAPDRPLRIEIKNIRATPAGWRSTSCASRSPVNSYQMRSTAL